MELLVRIVDKPKSGNAVLDAGRMEAGDVIHAAPDGHVWGKSEINHPEWKIIKVSGMTQTEADALLGRELATSPDHKLLRKRHIKLDLNKLQDTVIQREHLRSAIVVKSPLQDPNSIGNQRGVIG